MMLLYGLGYVMFSGVAGIGDIANVISGWEPVWLWRVLTTLVGSLMFMGCFWLALREFGKMVGGEPDEQIGRANKLSILSYVASLLVVLAGLFNTFGFLSLPVMAGLWLLIQGGDPALWRWTDETG